MLLNDAALLAVKDKNVQIKSKARSKLPVGAYNAAKSRKILGHRKIKSRVVHKRAEM